MGGEHDFLSDGWVAALPATYAEVPADGSPPVLVQHVVTDGPDGEVAYWVAVEHGRPMDAGPGVRPDAAVTVTTPYPLAADLATGRVEPSAAFMQGRAKVSGDQAALLRLLRANAAPAHRAATTRLAERTRL